MRIQLKLSKKSGLLLGLSLLFLFLVFVVGGILLVSSRNSSRYLDMVSTYCRVSEGKEGETLVQCRGILSDYSENTSKLGAGEECFQIFLIKEDYTLEEQTLCERKGFVEFD
jgi:hypothetical protein